MLWFFHLLWVLAHPFPMISVNQLTNKRINVYILLSVHLVMILGK
jgi:hypothetical protein